MSNDSYILFRIHDFMTESKIRPKNLEFSLTNIQNRTGVPFFYFYLVATYLSLETVIINPSGTIKFKHLSTGLLTKNRHY